MKSVAFFILSFLLFSFVLWVAMPYPFSMAEEPSQQKLHAGTDDNWEFGVVPYIWFMSMNGDATVKGNTASVDSSFSDIWDSLNFGLMGILQVRKGRIGGYADILYARLHTENAGLGPAGGTAASNATMVIADVVGFYRLGAFPLSSSDATPSVTLDPYVGFRSWTVRMGLNVRPTLTPTISVEGRQVWFDAIGGIRSNWDFADSWNAILKADVGGGSSDVTAQGLLTFGYRFDMWGQKNANVQLGYRVLYVDFSSGDTPQSFGLNATMHGPILGLGVTF